MFLSQKNHFMLIFISSYAHLLFLYSVAIFGLLLWHFGTAVHIFGIAFLLDERLTSLNPLGSPRNFLISHVKEPKKVPLEEEIEMTTA